MKTFLIGVCLACSFYLQAQTAEIIFINNLPTSDAENHTVEVTNSTGAVIASATNVAYQTTSGILEVPAEEILNITYKSSGGSTFATSNNAVLIEGRRYYQFIGGGPTGSTKIARSTFSTIAPNSGSFKYVFRNGSYDLGEIDVIVRGPGDKLVENLDQFDNSSLLPDFYVYASDEITLDITPAENNGQGICAYKMQASDFSAQNIIFFTSGPQDNLKCFVLSYDATLTELDKTDPVMTGVNGLYAAAIELALYPNPTSDFLQVDLPATNNPVQLQLRDLLGKTVKTWEMSESSAVLNIQDLPKGNYVLMDAQHSIKPVKVLLQ